MGVHVAGTQHGHTYYLGPLEGTRAPALIALRSRAPAARVEFWPLQHTIWQIEGGLGYNEMSSESRALIDQLIPEYRRQLQENFVQSLQKACGGGGILRKLSGGLCNDINATMARYQQTQQTLQRYANSPQALAQHIVNVIPGDFLSPGPASWSRLNPRVYARVTGGHIWQETSTLEVRVLPSSGATGPMANRRAPATLRDASYRLSAITNPSPATDSDTADVPIESSITYPDVGAGVQVLGLGLDPGGNSAPLVLKLEILNGQLMGVEHALLWIDCALPTSEATGAALAGDVVVRILQPSLEAQFAQAAGNTALLIDLGNGIQDLVTAGDPVGLFTTAIPQALLQAYGFSCNNYDLAKAIVSNLQRATQSTVPGTNAFTYGGIVPGSISISQGAVTAQATLKNGTNSRNVSFRLHLVRPAQGSAALTGGPISSATSQGNPTSQTIPTGGIPISPPTQQPPASGTQSDQAIVSDMNAKLWQDPVLKTQDIRVSAQNGVVTLTGTVSTEIQKHAVERIARSEKGVLQVINQLAVPVSSGSPAGNVTAPPRTGRITARSAGAIRSVDFRNFDYHSDFLGETVRVSNGEWNKVTEDQSGGYFGVLKIAYGDLKGDGQDEAVILTESAPEGMSPNVKEAQIFVFFMSSGDLKLLETLSAEDSGKGEEIDWSRVTDVQISKQQLAISYQDGGSRACAEWAVTARFQWSGSRFVRSGLDRKPFNCETQ